MKKFEFSKLITSIGIVIFAGVAIWSMIEYYALVKLAIANDAATIPDSSLPVTCIGTILGAILSYCLYQGALKSSLNKNKLTVDKVTGEIKSIMDCDYLDAVKDAIEKAEEDNEECKG